MKEYKLEPKTKGVSGHVLLSLPSYLERLKMLKEAGVNQGEVSASEMDTVIVLMEKIPQFVKEIKVTIDGDKIESFDDLGMYQLGTQVINEIMGVLAGGIPAKGKI